MKKIFIFLFVISVMICCIGCGKKATYKETTKTSDETVDLQGRDSEIEQLSQQVADLKIAVKDMQDIVNGTIAIAAANKEAVKTNRKIHMNSM